MTGIKESTWCDELWVFYATNDSLNSTPETNTTLSVTEIELKKKNSILFSYHLTAVVWSPKIIYHLLVVSR